MPTEPGFRLPLLCGLFPALFLTTGLPAATGSPPARMFPLEAVRITEGPFAGAVEVNRRYILALDPDRLLAPFLREAGLDPKAPSYENWENSGLDGHTAGHYLSALATMIAAGADTPDGELKRRLDHMLAELDRCQQAHGDGYLGGVPGSRVMWRDVAEGRIQAHGFGLNGKWVPWYNLHKTFAGLRDACVVAGNARAKQLLVRYGDWCVALVSRLSDDQMQDMLRAEFGGMNEVLADIHAITGDPKYLAAARRFHHRAVLDPLMRREDRLTGLHANTQIPKVIGMQRIAGLSDDAPLHQGARFFWETVTRTRNVAFGGNSVAEHFNPADDFRRMIEHREGPETCNTYNMLRLTAMLFEQEPSAAYADYYERALYNHILSSIHPKHPGYVYFTPIRPQHYRVYSEPDHCFWCCVGSGLENPGRYGEFIYAKAADGVYVNLFIPSEVRMAEGVVLRQQTRFPFAESSSIRLDLAKPSTFTVHLRHPGWVAEGAFRVRINGEDATISSHPGTYASVTRPWNHGDTIEIALPMRTRAERLPDGSAWVALLHGPIVLAAPAGTRDLTGLRADGSRMGHIAHGPLVALDQVPVLTTPPDQLATHVRPDPAAGPLHFRLHEGIEPPAADGLPLVPFFALHDQRYQIYWEITSTDQLAAQRAKRAAEENERARREAATLDLVTAGEQQPEVEHGLKGGTMETGIHEGRHWRHGDWFEYTLDPRGEKMVDLEVTYWGGDTGRTFDILANGQRIATQALDGETPGGFIRRRYPVPAELLAGGNPRLTIRFSATRWLAGGVYEVRLMKGSE